MSESASAQLGRILVIIPTYNEAENIATIVSRVRSAVPDAHVLIADDNSPDGTGKLADELAAADDHVHVMHRLGKEGLGAAYLAGFEWGLERGLRRPGRDGRRRVAPARAAATLLAALRRRRSGSRLALGQGRRGGELAEVPRGPVSRRQPVDPDRAGHPAAGRDRRATGPSAATTLLGLGLDNVASAGYCFQVDLAWRALKAGFRVVEVPITFVEREHGDSKMSQRIVVEALVRTTLWGVAHRAGQLRTLAANRTVLTRVTAS